MKTSCEEQLGSENFLKRKLRTEINVNWPRISAVKPAEHATCTDVAFFPSSEMFAVAITGIRSAIGSSIAS